MIYFQKALSGIAGGSEAVAKEPDVILFLLLDVF